VLDAGAAETRDAALSDNELDAGTGFRDVPPLRGSCDCSVGPRWVELRTPRSALIALFALSCSVRLCRRSERRNASQRHTRKPVR
jgi:hypothetical protein